MVDPFWKLALSMMLSCMLVYSSSDKNLTCNAKKYNNYPADTGRKLNVLKTFRRRPGRQDHLALKVYDD